jgi:hypothetical protein
MSSATVDAGDELQTFIRLARQIFHDEGWDEVEHYVERAWHAFQAEEGVTWDEVQPLVRAEWKVETQRPLSPPSL